MEYAAGTTLQQEHLCKSKAVGLTYVLNGFTGQNTHQLPSLL